jgi:hypothetical protein
MFFFSSFIFFVLVVDIEGFVGVKAQEEMARKRLQYLEGVKYVCQL